MITKIIINVQVLLQVQILIWYCVNDNYTDGFVYGFQINAPSSVTKKYNHNKRYIITTAKAIDNYDKDKFVSNTIHDNIVLDNTVEVDELTTLRSITFSNLRKDQEPDVLCELLMEYGACATWITDADRYTDNEVPIFHEPPLSSANSNNDMGSISTDMMINIPWIAPLWNTCNVTALFTSSYHIPSIIQSIQDIYTDIVVTTTTASDDIQMEHDNINNDGLSNAELVLDDTVDFLESYSMESIPNNIDWVTTVQQGWKPIIIPNCFLLYFPWHTPNDISMAMNNYTTDSTTNNTLIPILLQGGIAFGTGEHATTQLCLEWLYRQVQTLLLRTTATTTTQSIRVLDYGTGSGILGIAACAIGRQYQQQQQQQHQSITTSDDNCNDIVSAVGIDIDIDACRIANLNAMLNGNVTMRSFLPPLSNNNTMDRESQSVLMKAYYNSKNNNNNNNSNTQNDSKQVYDDILIKDGMGELVLQEESFDIGIANILAGPLIALAPTLYGLLKPGAYIGMSGILQHQNNTIVSQYESIGFINVQVEKVLDGWILVIAQRPPN